MPSDSMVATGVDGLDDVLCGGFSRGNIFLLEGNPGTGKTTLAIRFLLTGAEAGERGLYITMSETERELRDGASSHGWTIGNEVDVFELAPPESRLHGGQEQSLLYSSDLELGETTQLIIERIRKTKADRIVLDSLSEIRLLAQGSLRYRRQILALKHFFSSLGATVLLLDDLTSDVHDKTVHSVVHGVIRLEDIAHAYGGERRRLRVSKYRGKAVRGGYHDFAIRTGGISVFPRLVAAEYRTSFERRQIQSDNPQLDELLGGGVERGSSVLLMGPAGTGKSTFILQFIAAAAARGEKSALFVFDEELQLLLDRSLAFGFDLRAWRDAGLLHLEQVDVAELSPGEFAHRLRALATDNLTLVAVDSLNGYRAAMPDELSLTLHVHEFLQYLNRCGVTAFITLSQHGLIGNVDAPVELTYLADTVVLLRYFETDGAVRRAVSVIKKRMGKHEATIREFRIAEHGLALGEPLRGFSGVLAGGPVFHGDDTPLLDLTPTDRH